MIDIDRAWDRLHTRLVDEKLLSQGAKVVGMPFITKIKWAAAVVALCVLSGAIGLYLSLEKENSPLISIHNGDRINTLVKTLDDGSVVYLTSGATITCPEQFATDKRQLSVQGDVLFDIKSNKDCPFLIETEAVLVEVLGTTFNIKTEGKESFELSVQHGVVKVTLKSTGAHSLVETGETIRLEDRQQLLKEQLTDRQQFDQYAEKICFKDEQLENIVHIINKKSDKPIIISDETLKSSEITISFDNNTVEEMIELLCMVLNLKYTEDGKEIVIGW
jgi:ferric-dicitrate binding protein FerR (iron transport regulator)